MRWLVSVFPTPTGAGFAGLIRVPGGTRITTGRSQPSFITESGSHTALSAYSTAAWVTPRIALIGRGTCGSVPAKSTVTESGATMTAARIQRSPPSARSSSRQSSAAYRPGGSTASARRAEASP